MTRPIARMTALGVAAMIVVPSTAGAQQIALTFDDLPSHSALPDGETRLGVASRIIAALDEANAPPSYGFINGGAVIGDPEAGRVLSLWRAAGHPLGNHTWTHMRLDDGDVAPFKAEVQTNEPLLAAVMGEQDWRWFRYPYLYEGASPEARADVRAFLSERGYRVASVTLNFDDYAWNEPYARCLNKGDAEAIERLEATYLAAARDSLVQARARAMTAVRRDIPYVLLMHIGAFDARMMPRLLAQYRREGATFVTLEQAQADSFYDGDVLRPLSAEPVQLPSFEGEPPGSVIPADFEGLCRGS